MAMSLGQAAKAAIAELKRTKANLVLAYQATLYDIGKTLVFYTPIDTGLASSNWNVSNKGRISTIREPVEGDKGTAALEAMAIQVKDLQPGTAATFNNPVDYTPDLEDGFSRQAPAGMITPTKPLIDAMWLNNLRQYNLI